MAASKHERNAHHFPPHRDFSSLSVRDLLEARDVYHLHLAHLENVVATGIGRFRIRKEDGDARDPKAKWQKAGQDRPRTLEDTVVTSWSWPCVLVFVRQWASYDRLRGDPDQAVPRFLYLPDGRVVPTCVVLVREQECVPGTQPDWIFPSGLIGGGYPILTQMQGRDHISSVACLVSDGTKTFALTNRHVSGPKGQCVDSLLAGRRAQVGLSAGKDIGKIPFSAAYPGWPGTHTLANLDAGLIAIDDVRQWTTQVYGIGQVGEPVDLNTDTITLDMIGCPLRAFGCASGPLRGQIMALFYRYRTIGGNDYTADLLIGPRDGDPPLKTAPGDSGTLWFFDPRESGPPDQPPPSAGPGQLLPLAMQWGGHALLGDGEVQFPLALATCLSTICRELDVEVVRGWNVTHREYWGKTGHYKVGAQACALVRDPELRRLLQANLDQIAFGDDCLRLGKDFKVNASEFVPLADVPDYVWVSARRRNGKICFYDHFADMDEDGKGDYAGKTLFDLCTDEKNVDVRAWNRFYDSLGRDTLNRGKLPFRVWQVYEDMVAYLKNGELNEFLCSAGILAHYVADASQPLHGSYLSHGDPDNPTNVHKVFDQAVIEQNVGAFLDKVNEGTKGRTVATKDLVENGHSAAVAVVDLMRRTAETLPARRVVDVFEEVQGRGQAKALWDQLGPQIVAIMADGCYCLAVLWESAWFAGGGKDQFGDNDLKAVPRPYLKKLYSSREFLPDRSLEEMQENPDRNIGLVP
jgi:hypothetical protein